MKSVPPKDNSKCTDREVEDDYPNPRVDLCKVDVVVDTVSIESPRFLVDLLLGELIEPNDGRQQHPQAGERLQYFDGHQKIAIVQHCIAYGRTAHQLLGL